MSWQLHINQEQQFQCLKLFKINKMVTFKHNQVPTLERNMWPLLEYPLIKI